MSDLTDPERNRLTSQDHQIRRRLDEIRAELDRPECERHHLDYHLARIAHQLDATAATFGLNEYEEEANEPDHDNPPAPERPEYQVATAAGGAWLTEPVEDLGALQQLADDLSRRQRVGLYPIHRVDGGPARPWGVLSIEGHDRWEIVADDGTTRVLPGAIIL